MGRARKIISAVDDHIASGYSAPEIQQGEAKGGQFNNAESQGASALTRNDPFLLT
jgi:hypothetical protein